MLIDCACGASNRIPALSSKKMRCGKCQHIFTPQELTRARREPPPEKPDMTELLDTIFGAPEGDHDDA